MWLFSRYSLVITKIRHKIFTFVSFSLHEKATVLLHKRQAFLLEIFALDHKDLILLILDFASETIYINQLLVHEGGELFFQNPRVVLELPNVRPRL